MNEQTPAEVWCARCDQPSIADFHIGDETIALCGFHAGTEAWPSQIAENERWTEPELREAWGR